MTAFKNLPRGAWAELDAAILKSIKRQRRQCLEDICSVSEVRTAFKAQLEAWEKLNKKAAGRSRLNAPYLYGKVSQRLQALKKAGEVEFCEYSRVWRMVL